MKTKQTLTIKDVRHIGILAKIPLTSLEEQKLTTGFNEVLKVVEKLFELNTENIQPTHHVTGLSNIFREDKVDKGRILTQKQTLSTSKRSNNGYFVVNQILDE